MAAADTYSPSTIFLGGATLSPSLLDATHLCEHKAFAHYLAPHPDAPGVTAGLAEPHLGPGLFVGSMVHAGLHAYRAAGWRDGGDSGEYSLEAGVEAARAYGAANAAQLEHPDTLPEHAAEATGLLVAYHGDAQLNPFLRWRTAPMADGTPMLERALTVPLAGGHFELVVKLDAGGIFPDRPRTLVAVEYKTTSPRYVLDWRRGADLSAQARAEAAAIAVNFPAYDEHASQFELIVKDRGQKSKYDVVEPVAFTLEAPTLARWLAGVERTALRLSWAAAEWHSRVAAGDDPWDAGADIFPTTGMQGSPPACVRFGRECEFAARCKHPEMDAKWTLGALRVRTRLEDQ